MKTKHTPVPWRSVLSHVKGEHAQIIGGAFAPRKIGSIYYQAEDYEIEANREFIVRACNSHEALVEACKEAVSVLGKIPAFGDSIGTEINKPQIGIAHNLLSRALALAEGGK